MTTPASVKFQSVVAGVADAGGIDLDQHLAGARALQIHGLDDERGTDLPGHGCAGLHVRCLPVGKKCECGRTALLDKRRVKKG